MHRLGLASAYEALEMAGYVPNRTPSTRLERIGTFYGQTSDDWREINEAQDIDTYFITAGVRAFAPVRIDPKTSSNLFANQYSRDESIIISSSVVPALALIPLVPPAPPLCSSQLLLYGLVIAIPQSLVVST